LDKPISIAQARQLGSKLLSADREIPVDTAALEAEILLCHCLQKNRAYLRTWPQAQLSKDQETHYRQLLARRQQGEPIAYITGYKEFWDLRLRVTPAVLIPRPETELLVELALARIPVDARWHIADLGTGSGAIALAIAKHRPRCLVNAVDLSTASLKLAGENAADNHVNNVSFHQGSWFAPLTGKRFQVIVANPPYIAENDPHLQQGDLRFEPPQALSSKHGGLHDLQHIISQAPHYLNEPGWLLLEHGYQQGDSVTALLKRYGFCEVQCHADYAQLERVSMGKFTQHNSYRP
jgi:release factor glutamine methyltransferase